VIEELKLKGLKSAGAFCEDRLRTPIVIIGVHGQELYHAIRCVLPVCIHNDHSIASNGDMKVCKPNSNGTLMAKISAQAQHTDGPNGSIRALEISGRAVLSRTVINEQYFHSATVRT
jgi:hypothetical protein